MSDFDFLTYCVGIADAAQCTIRRDHFTRLLVLAGHDLAAKPK